MFRTLWSYIYAPPPEKKTNKVVLVIGETGDEAGKSSLINLIVGEDVANTSVQRRAYETEDYKYEHFVMVDTVGYIVEESPGVALKNLAKFANKVMTDGISLIAYVMKQGRVTASSRKHYDYFVNTLCQNKVPVVLVVTHCELDDDAQKWYHKQSDAFRTLEMNFSDFLCGSAIDLTDSTVQRKLGRVLKLKREETKSKVLDMMERWALETAWKPEKNYRWLNSFS